MAQDISCEEFDNGVDELAVGALTEPERSTLLAHAASCPMCDARLNGLAGLADRLLLLVPEVEPPDGFEKRVLARSGFGPAGTTEVTSAPGGRPPRWRRLAAVAAVAALLGSGIALGRVWPDHSSSPAAADRHGDVLTSSGTDIGLVELKGGPRPQVVLALYGPDHPGVVSCQLELAHGRVVTIGTWSYGHGDGSAWAVSVDRSLVGAVRMRIVDQQGTVLATASLA